MSKVDEKKLMDFVMDVTLGYSPNLVRSRMNDAIAKHFPEQVDEAAKVGQQTSREDELVVWLKDLASRVDSCSFTLNDGYLEDCDTVEADETITECIDYIFLGIVREKE
jgi:hypothetical protein